MTKNIIAGDTQVQREREFHNQWAKDLDIESLLVKESFEKPTAIENKASLKQMGDLKGKKLLDLGCGAGETSVYFATQGAEVHACDVAEDFLPVGNRLAEKYNTSVTFLAASATELPYKDETFDIVFGNGVLHHVDLELSAKEIKRVLKPGGKAIFIEPLPYNPIINVYRYIARDVRTVDEKPLTNKQIKDFVSNYSSNSKQYCWFFSLYIFIHFFLVKRWHPGKVRYWKKVIEVGDDFSGIFRFLQKIDHFLMKYVPFLRPLCWNVVITTVK